MSKIQKPPNMGRILIPLAQPKAVLMVVDNVARVVFGPKQRLVKDNILLLLRAHSYVTNFVEIDPGRKTLIATITPEGSEEARRLLDEAENSKYTQLYFDDIEGKAEALGDAIRSEVVVS